MTRDEVLEQAADALASEAVDDAFATLREGPAIVRALKSKPPEKSPEMHGDPERGTNLEIVTKWRDREGHKSMAPIELASLGNVLWDAGDLPRVLAERDALRRQLPQYDCTHTGGPVSDSGGKHCPPEAPCLTCRLERAEEENAEIRRLWEAEKATWLAEVARLKWEQSGSPMKGETPSREGIATIDPAMGSRCSVITGPEDVCGRLLPCSWHPK